MDSGQTNKNIPVLTDVASPGAPAPLSSAGQDPSTVDSTKQSLTDIQARQLVEYALPIIMPELEKLARKTLLELIKKLQQRKSRSQS